LTVNDGTLDYSGGVLPACNYTITGGTLDIGANSKAIGAFRITGGTLSGTGTLTSSSAYDIQAGTVNAVLAGTNIALNKTGAGTAILAGANTYTGPTTISAGTLKVNNSADSATGTGAVGVNSGGILAGAGLIGGPVSINAGGTLAPGNSPGILTVNNRVTFAAGSFFNVEVNGLAAGTGYDQLKTAGPVSLAGTLSLSFGDFAPLGGDMLFLIDNIGAAATTGKFQFDDNGKIGTFDGCDWFITYDAESAGVPRLDGGNDVAIYTLAVPEPATAALLAIALASLLAYTLRRRAA
jgi:autotransporter-associated beta strand protein